MTMMTCHLMMIIGYVSYCVSITNRRWMMGPLSLSALMAGYLHMENRPALLKDNMALELYTLYLVIWIAHLLMEKKAPGGKEDPYGVRDTLKIGALVLGWSLLKYGVIYIWDNLGAIFHTIAGWIVDTMGLIDKS